MRIPWYRSTTIWGRLRLARAFLETRRAMGNLPVVGSGHRVLLAINHFFDGEIAALVREPSFQQEFSVVELPFDPFFKAHWSFFPPEIWRGTAPYDDARFEGGRIRSRAAATRLWNDLRVRFGVVGVLTPSDTFFWVREFLRVADESGAPTFMFDKEGVISPATFDNQPHLISTLYPSIARHLYVWNQRQVEYWGRAGVPSDRIEVLGALRTDLFVRMPPSDRRGVLFFDFDTYAYLEDLADPVGTAGGWAPLKDEIHEVLVQFARRYPTIPVTIKCHPQQTDLPQTQARFAEVGPNVSVQTGSVDVDRLVETHSLIVGFQTTALLETALTDRPAIYCGWGDLHDRVQHRLLPLMQSGFGIVRCNGPDELRDLLASHVDGRAIESGPDRHRIEEYFHRPDGATAKRYVEALKVDLGIPA